MSIGIHGYAKGYQWEIVCGGGMGGAGERLWEKTSLEHEELKLQDIES